MSVIVLGAGLAGLSASIKLTELGCKVILISPDFSERSQSVMAMGGINASIDKKDTIKEHYNDTLHAGRGINNKEAVYNLCNNAPNIIKWLSNLGVVFNRESNGDFSLRYFAGQKNKRTLFSASQTGKQILTALITKVREKEINGSIKRLTGWRFLSLIIKNNECLGLNIINTNTNEIKQILSSSVIICTGGLNKLFNTTSGSIQNDGYTTAKLLTQGLELANLEMIQYHPTTIKTSSKRILITEAARGEGGKLYINTSKGPFYFMEEWYPEAKELMPRDIVSQSIYKACKQYNKENAYLDIRHLDKNQVKTNLNEVYELSKTFLGINPLEKPIPIYPGIHYFMGGILTDKNHKTNIKRLFAAGECSCQYHGANRLGGNSLLGAINGGITAAIEASKLKKQESTGNYEIFETKYPEFNTKIRTILSKSMGIYRNKKDLKEGLEELKTIKETEWTILAEAILKSALERKESRGAHQREDYPKTEKEYEKTTISKYNKNHVEIEFRKI